MLSRKTLLVLGIVILGAIFLPRYSRLQQLKARNKALERQIEELERENMDLTRQIDRLENDPLYVEKKAREKMGISKKGEIIYKIVDDNR